MRVPWPSRLSSRLVVLLVSALALAQGAVVLVLHDEQRAVAETMAHGQALNQAVTLARLLTQYPASQEQNLTDAFGSRMTCAIVEPGPPTPRAGEATRAEARLAEQLRRMLHGDYAGPPMVILRQTEFDDELCGPRSPSPQASGRENSRPQRPPSNYSADVLIPLTDGRTLRYVSALETPKIPVWIATASFLLSALAVAGVVIVSVRHQTRSLRELADAAERLGRGEEVPPLSDRGPAEIATVIHAFDTMRDRLRRHMSERLALLAAIGHDLRTPLTTLRLKAEFVEDETVRDDLVATLDELTAITEATLAFTRAEVSREETRRLELSELVGEIVAEFRLAGREAVLEAPSPVPFEGRPVALKRAVRNIVENAIRYGGSARVSVLDQADHVLVLVEDEGPGLPEDRIDEAFRPFVRLEPSRSRETGGLGLGLSIARGVVHGHGGTIRLVNRTNGGLRVEIALPHRAERPPTAAAPANDAE